MQTVLWLLILVCATVAADNESSSQSQQFVAVADPYVELHTGPGRGYPVFYVASRGERMRILKRRTSWFKVQVNTGETTTKEGWVARDQMERTLAADGAEIEFVDPRYRDAIVPHWEAGVLGGDFDGASVNSLYGAYLFTQNIGLELSASHVLGDFSQSQLYSLSVVNYPFPTWHVAPFFTLGAGRFSTQPRATLAETPDRSDDIINVGLGIRSYLTRRFFLRVEYKSYVVLTNRDDNEELEEWKAGFSVFF